MISSSQVVKGDSREESPTGSGDHVKKQSGMSCRQQSPVNMGCTKNDRSNDIHVSSA